MHYTESQRRAIEHRRGNLLVLACAGSGKTEVMSRRIAELVGDGVARDEIVAFTFTERAASELKTRIRTHFEELFPDDPSIGDMYVGTIHSFCLGLLKEVEPRYRNFEVMDEARQVALIMTNFHYFPDSESGIGLDRLRARTRSGGYWDTVYTFLSTLNVIHQQNLPLSEVRDSETRSAVERYRDIAHGAPNYFFDFNQIIDELIQALKRNPGRLEAVREHFQHLVVDEYQDVDDRQEELIGLITDHGRRVTIAAVGDDDQAIYGWRGAQISNILSFEQRYPDVTVVRLTFNFRSTHGIAEIAMPAVRIIKDRIPKDMEARHLDLEAPGGFAETLAAPGDIQLREFESEEDEAAWVADQVAGLRGTLLDEGEGERGLDYADMAILLRSVRAHGSLFAEALRDRGIPAVIKGTGGLFEHDEVQLVQAALYLLARSDLLVREDDGPRLLQQSEIRELVREKIHTLSAQRLMPSAASDTFLEWIAQKREELDRRNLEKDRRGHLARRIYPQALFQELLAALGSNADPDPWPNEVLFNLGRLSYLVAQFETVHQWITPADLVSLCMFLGGWAASQVDEGGLEDTGSQNAVQILTVHGAKGLEWPVVFLPRISSANFPSSLRNRGPRTFLDDDQVPPGYASGDDGERRLWYVGLTRCRRFLNVSSVDRSRKRPSRFYKEISHEVVSRQDPLPSRSRGKPQPLPNVGQLPTTYTDLSYFWRCQFEYQLRSVMGFSPGVRESYGYGQQIHNVLAEIHQSARDGVTISPEDAVALMERRFHLRYTRDGDEYKPLTALREAAKESVRRYLQSYPDALKYVLQPEKPFEFLDHENAALISGVVDLVERLDIDPDGKERRTPVAIVDFKTHQWRDEQSFLRSRSEVERQLGLYAIAAREALGFDAKSARAHFLAPRPPTSELAERGVSEVVNVDVSPAAQKEIRSAVSEAVSGIRTALEDRFALDGVDGGHCRRCDFRAFCPGFLRWTETDKISPRPEDLESSMEEEALLAGEDSGAWATSE